MAASVLDFSSVSNVIFLLFFFWESWKVGVRILYTAKSCAQHWLSSNSYRVLQQHVITDDCRGRAAAAPFFPKLSHKLSFHEAECAGPVAKSSDWICCSFCKRVILQWDCQTPMEVVEKPLLLFCFCAQWICVQIVGFFVCFVFSIDGGNWKG